MTQTPFGKGDGTNTRTWDWGTVVTPSGEVIPPGACEGYHNKDKQRDILR